MKQFLKIFSMNFLRFSPIFLLYYICLALIIWLSPTMLCMTILAIINSVIFLVGAILWAIKSYHGYQQSR